MNSRGLIKYLVSAIKEVPLYPWSIRLIIIPMITSGDACGRSLYSTLFLFFKFRQARLVPLLRCMCSVVSSSLFFSKVFRVD